MTASGVLAQQRGTMPAAGDGHLPLSPAQQGFWLLQSLDPASTAANEQFALFLDGPLDRGALAQAWRGVLARHEILRPLRRRRWPALAAFRRRTRRGTARGRRTVFARGAAGLRSRGDR